MGKEIERKFLVDLNKLEYSGVPIIIKQGYLLNDDDKVIRIRTINTDFNSTQKAYITIKSAVVGITRDEFEYEIPYQDGLSLINMCDKVIEKIRYNIYNDEDDFVWELDIFKGDNKGLFVAEIELKNEDDKFFKPDWITTEVTNDKRYYNSNLINNSYKNW